MTILPETGKIASGIEKALRDVDVKAIAQKWKEEIEAKLKNIEVKIDADPKKALESAEALRHAIESEPIKVKIKADSETAKAETQLDATARPRKAKIIAEVDKAAAAKAGAELKAGMASGTGKGFFGKGGGVNLPFRTTIPLPVGIEAVGIAPNVVPLLGSMTQGITQLSGAFALLPSVIGAAGLAFGSLKIGMSGFADAIKEIGDPEKFAEAIKQLSPAAQEAATAIQGLMPQVTQLKMTVQDALFTGMGEQFTKLGSTYLPIFQDVMSRMAQSAGVAFQGVSKMLQTPEMQADIKTFGANASTAFNTLLTAAQPLVKAFTDIATVGSTFLPQLAQIVSDLAKRFGDFIGNARESGKLAEWIQNGIIAFGQLKDIVVNVWDIFKGLFQSAEGDGQGFLGTIENITFKWATWINSIGGQDSLKRFFDDARESLEKVWEIAQDLGPVLYNVFMGAKAVIDAMLPLIQQITGFMAQWPDFATAVGVAIGAWSFASTLKSIAGVSTALLGLGTVGGTAGTAAGGALRAGILSGFGGSLTIPILLAASVATVGMGLSAAHEAGVTPEMLRYPGLRDPRSGRKIGDQGTPPGWTGGGGDIGPAGPADIANRDFGVGRGRWGGLPPSAGPHAPKPAPAAAVQPYIPPAPVSGGGGTGGAGAGAPEPKPPPGMSYTYSGFGELNWNALAQLESGGNWSANTGNGFYGGLQFIQSTWEAYGGLQFAPTADQADESDQKKVATALYNKEGPAPWPKNGWVLTADPNQLKAAGLTGSGRVSTSSTRGNRGGGYGGAPQLNIGPGGIPTVAPGTSFGAAGSQQPAQVAAGAISQLFPGIKTIGGQRPDSKPYHREGRAIDVMIPNYNTPEGKAMGDQIKQWAMDNAEALGVEDTIWQDFWQPTSGGAGKKLGRSGDTAGHYDHVHITFKEGATANTGQLNNTTGQYSYDGPGMDPSNPMYTTSKDTGGEQLGKDIITGMLDVFGFGDLFKSPLDMEAFKLFKGAMGVPGKMFGEASVNGVPLFGQGGGSGPMGFLSNMMSPYGPLGSGSPGNAPGEFIPGLSGGSGGLVGDITDMIAGEPAGPGGGPNGRGGMVNSNNFTANVVTNNATPQQIGDEVKKQQGPQARVAAHGWG